MTEEEKQAAIDKWLAWRKDMNSRHRTMTWGEYRAWSVRGDSVSHPSSANALRGGLTIIYDSPSYIGKIEGVYEG